MGKAAQGRTISRADDRVTPRVSFWVLIGATLLGALFTGCAHDHSPLHPEGPAGSWYLVKDGDTLESLATQTHVPVEDLVEINGLHRGERLTPGQLIYLLDAEGLVGKTAVVDRAVVPESRAGGVRPLRWPLQSPHLSSPFGTRQGRRHEGIDLAAPTGTPVYAADSGHVLYAGDGVRGYGNMVVLEHASGMLTVYAHNSVVLVKTGAAVRVGQEIARVGQSGHATAPHLHFEVRHGEVPEDPMHELPPLK